MDDNCLVVLSSDDPKNKEEKYFISLHPGLGKLFVYESSRERDPHHTTTPK